MFYHCLPLPRMISALSAKGGDSSTYGSSQSPQGYAIPVHHTPGTPGHDGGGLSRTRSQVSFGYDSGRCGEFTTLARCGDGGNVCRNACATYQMYLDCETSSCCELCLIMCDVIVRFVDVLANSTTARSITFFPPTHVIDKIKQTTALLNSCDISRIWSNLIF